MLRLGFNGGLTMNSAKQMAAAPYPTSEFASEVQTLEHAFAGPSTQLSH